jgi:putative spermidine/putrescine transport system permease protein
MTSASAVSSGPSSGHAELRPAWLERPGVMAGLLLAPAIIFLGIFFLLPVVNMIGFSFLTQNHQGVAVGPPTLANYVRFFEVDLYARVMRTTIEVAVITTLLASLLGYPIALVMVRGNVVVMRIVTALVLAPLLLNVVIRTYGWKVVLANGSNGLLNQMMMGLGLIEDPMKLLFTPTAIVIGSLHVFLPLMVLPLAAALSKIDPNLEDAARTLGAPGWRTFWRVTIPLSVPGLAAGTTLVFSLTASSFVTPAILGGNLAKMLGTLVQEQILGISEWPFGAAIATVMITIVLAINLAYIALIERRMGRRGGAK